MLDDRKKKLADEFFKKLFENTTPSKMFGLNFPEWENFNEDYNLKCLNCDRVVYVGKCCYNHLTQQMVDDRKGGKS